MSTSAGSLPQSNDGISVREISFDVVPGQSKLFRDIQRGVTDALELFPAGRSIDSIAANCSQVIDGYLTDRPRLVAELVRQNERFGMTDAVRANLDRLLEPDTVAVITGQQAGLFTGPAYTIYKALSAIKLAAELNRRGQKAVSIFWIASEDHDIDEVTWAGTGDGYGNEQRIEILTDSNERGRPVGDLRLGDHSAAAVENFTRALERTRDRDAVEADLAKLWAANETFSSAFGRTIAHLLGYRGLILVDPMSIELRQLSSALFEMAVLRSDDFVGSVLDRNAELDRRGYHTQVEIDTNYFPLFRFDDNGKRRTIRKIGEDLFREKDGDQRFTRSELASEVLTEPERYSPGVLFRPVVQDVLFPTACYIGGAAEVSYFAQNSGVYSVLGRLPTPVIHRASLTLIGSRQRKQMSKCGISFENLFEPADELRQRLDQLGSERDLAALFTETEKTIDGELDRLGARLSEFDVTLAASLERRRRRMIYHIIELRRRSLIESGRRSELLGDRLDDLYRDLLPEGQLQERFVNIFALLARFGDDLLDRLYEVVDVESTGHLLVDLER